MAHDVFISYSSKDKTIADAVCARLEGRGIRCWIAPRDVQPGQPYGEEIIDAIHSSRAMVLVFSSHANASPHIPKEVERAVSHGVSIIPLRVEAVAPGKSLDYFISSVHWLDAITPPLEQHLESLARTILTMLPEPGRPPLQSAVPAPAVSPAPPAMGKKNLALWAAIAAAFLIVVAGAFYFSQRSAQTVADQQPGTGGGGGSTPANPGPPAPAARDPIIGCWQWYNNVQVAILPDARLVAGPFTARWQRGSGRSYRFTWPEAVDAVTLSGDGNSLRGSNQYGFAMSAARVSPGRGIAGTWRWANGAMVLIRPDGVFTSGPFTGRWASTGPSNFSLTWPDPVDNVSLSPDLRRISGGNQYGIPITATKIGSACGG